MATGHLQAVTDAALLIKQLAANVAKLTKDMDTLKAQSTNVHN